jgi:hypothetical protein
MWRRFTFLLLAVTMLASIDFAPSAQAQDTAKTARKAPRTLQRTFVATDLVSEPAAADGLAGTGINRERLEKRLAWEIKRIDQIYGLTQEQQRKLEVAGRGDIKRFIERVQEKRKPLDRAKENRLELVKPVREQKEVQDRDLQNVIEFRNEYREALIEVRALTKDIPVKLFVEGSIFIKTLKKTFSPEQRKKYEKDQLDFYRSRVEWAVVSGLGALKLSDDQRQRLVKLIVQNNRPLRRYGRHDFAAVMIQASRLPENTLKPIFDEAQWRRLRVGLKEVKRLEHEVVTGGYLPEEEDRPAGDAAHGIREEG